MVTGANRLELFFFKISSFVWLGWFMTVTSRLITADSLRASTKIVLNEAIAISWYRSSHPTKSYNCKRGYDWLSDFYQLYFQASTCERRFGEGGIKNSQFVSCSSLLLELAVFSNVFKSFSSNSSSYSKAKNEVKDRISVHWLTAWPANFY